MDLNPLKDPTGQPRGEPTAQHFNLWELRHVAEPSANAASRHRRTEPDQIFSKEIPPEDVCIPWWDLKEGLLEP